MKVLIVNDFCNEKGGAQVFDQRLLETLRQRGYQASIFCAQEAGYVRDYLYSIYNPMDHNGLRKTIKRFRPDIVFTSCIGYRLSPLLLGYPAMSDIPVCVKIPDYSIYGYPNLTVKHPQRIFTYPQSLIQRSAIRRFTSRVIVQSNQSRQYAIDEMSVSDDKIELIRNPTFLNPIDEISHEVSQRVLFVGRLDGKKGVEFLIKAIAGLDSVNLEIVGDGNEKEALEACVQDLDIKDRVTFHGYVDHDRLPDIYQKSDVFVLPSIIEESYGLTIVEAMSQGTPVITTNIGAQQELVKSEKTGFIVPPADHRELRKRISEILSDRQLQRELSENALAFARQLTIPRYVTKLEAIFEELIPSTD